MNSTTRRRPLAKVAATALIPALLAGCTVGLIIIHLLLRLSGPMLQLRSHRTPSAPREMQAQRSI